MIRNPAGGAAALILILILSLVGAQPLFGQNATEDPIGDLEAKSRQAFADGRPLPAYNANMKLLRHRPYEAKYFVNLVRAAALMNRRSVAYDFMLQMQQQGLSHDFNREEDTVGIRNSEAYEYINGLLIEAGQPAGDGSPVFELPGPASDLGAITWDSSRKAYLVGTIKRGELMAVSEKGKIRSLMKAPQEGGPWSINGLAVDAAGNRLWISSSTAGGFRDVSPAQKGSNAVFEYTLDSLKLVQRYELQEDSLAHDLGALARTDGGEVYVVDRAQPIVFLLKPGEPKLEPFVASNDLVRLTDISAVPDNSRVFVSDEAKGVWVIDPIAMEAAMLSGPENLNLGNITGLRYDEGKLLMIQGRMTPQRLLRLELDDTGSKVSAVSPMAIALEAFDEPGIGTIREDGLYYVANAAVTDGAAKAIIMKTPLDAGSQIESPPIRQFQKGLENSQQP